MEERRRASSVPQDAENATKFDRAIFSRFFSRLRDDPRPSPLPPRRHILIIISSRRWSAPVGRRFLFSFSRGRARQTTGKSISTPLPRFDPARETGFGFVQLRPFSAGSLGSQPADIITAPQWMLKQEMSKLSY